MSGFRKYRSLRTLGARLRDTLNNTTKPTQIVLLFAYNRTGKTRLSMEFKEAGKRKNKGGADTLYFNAYTEDLFTWENDLGEDSYRHLRLNSDSAFFDAPRQLNLNADIEKFLSRYVDFTFDIDYENWTVSFSRDVLVAEKGERKLVRKGGIKISRGEENIFRWCFFMAICERLVDNDVSYAWVRYIYVDDPISSLDDSNAIAVACDLAKLLRRAARRVDEDGAPDPVKVVVSSHHALFFNVMCNEMRRVEHCRLFLRRPDAAGAYGLSGTADTPFFHHVAVLEELQRASQAGSGTLYTYHFNALRSVFEKTASFFGAKEATFWMDGRYEDAYYNRAVQLLSHGGYSVFDPAEMGEDNKELFRRILQDFLERFSFNLADVRPERPKPTKP